MSTALTPLSTMYFNLRWSYREADIIRAARITTSEDKKGFCFLWANVNLCYDWLHTERAERIGRILSNWILSGYTPARSARSGYRRWSRSITSKQRSLRL